MDILKSWKTNAEKASMEAIIILGRMDIYYDYDESLCDDEADSWSEDFDSEYERMEK